VAAKRRCTGSIIGIGDTQSSALNIFLTPIQKTFIMSFFKKLFAGESNAAVKKIAKEDVLLVDVRSAEEYTASPVPGAVHIPLDILPQKLSFFSDKKNIVVFCRSGNRSHMAKTWLEKNGVTGVINGGSREQVLQLYK
jgi:phage shock protein E